MGSISHVSNIHRADASKHVGKNALVSSMELVVRNIVGAPRAARTALEDAIAPRVSVGAASARALQLGVNVTQTSAEIVGSAVEMAHWMSHQREGMVINAAI